MDMLLIKQIKDGDVDAFKIAYSIYQSKLHNFIYSKTGSVFYANEITQVTFMKLWEHRCNLNEELKISTQVFQIAKTSLIDVLRKTERERLKVECFCQSGAQQNIAGDDLIENYNADKILQTIIDRMPPMRKKVFSLRIQQQLSYKEISSKLSISLKTVNKHMELALPQARSVFKSLLQVVVLIIVKIIN